MTYGRESSELVLRRVENGWTGEDETGKVYIFRNPGEVGDYAKRWADKNAPTE